MKIKREIDGKEVEIELTGPEILTVFSNIYPFIKILKDDYGFGVDERTTKVLAIESYKEYKDSNNLSEYEVIDKMVDKFNIDRLSLEKYEEIL